MDRPMCPTLPGRGPVPRTTPPRRGFTVRGVPDTSSTTARSGRITVQRRTFVRSVVAGALAVSLSAAAGCSDDSKDDGDKGTGQSLEKITYLTSFGTFGRDAYAYVAKEKGYFSDAGFDVDIKPGSGTGENIKQIVGGQIQFTPLDLTGLLLAAGAPKDPITGFAAVA